MIKRFFQQLTYYQFERLVEFPQLKHGVFTRYGGISEAPYDSLNVAFSVGDDPAVVKQNRQRIADSLDISAPIYCQQVHGDTVLIADPAINADEPFEGDALVTRHKDLFIGIQVADCQSVVLYDPVAKIVANIHSGWRGSLLNIIGKTVQQMRRMGSQPQDIIAGIGPSLGPCCAEFVNYRKELPQAIHSYERTENHFDFWQLSHDQLTEQGVVGENIEKSHLCTRCDEAFFSYRREKTTGRFATVIGFKAH